MFDHITFRVKDIEKTKDFYSKALAPIGYKLCFEQVYGDIKVIGLSHEDGSDIWFSADKPASGPAHIAWRVNSTAEVDAFYEAAIAAGGKDNGKPGKREVYHPKYYGAFVIDPDGHNIEAVFHEAE